MVVPFGKSMASTVKLSLLEFQYVFSFTTIIKKELFHLRTLIKNARGLGYLFTDFVILRSLASNGINYLNFKAQ